MNNLINEMAPMPITPCEKCGGSGYTDPGNVLVCCPIGHAKTCQCRVCQWSQAYYRQKNKLVDLQAEAQATATHSRAVDIPRRW